MRLYRYRNIEKALKELDKGTFYFAHYKELNDPIEGALKLYWQGDKYAWEGLFKDYICSLFNYIRYYLDSKKRYFEKDLKQVGMIINLSRFNSLTFGNVRQNLYNEFLENKFIKMLINFLSFDNKKIYSKQIKLFFSIVHFIALHICLKKVKKNINSELLPLNISKKLCEKMTDLINIEQLSCIYANKVYDGISYIDNFNGYYKDILLDVLRSKYSNSNNFKKYMHYHSIIFEYPNIYINNLKDIIYYPAGHIVCFSKSPDNSSMWGNYADNHKGICFIYETKNVNNKEVITVESQDIEVKEIKYQNNLIEKNFFLSLCGLSLEQIKNFLSGENRNKVSPLLDDYLSSKEEKIEKNKLIKECWNDCEEIFLRKMIDWKYESEYRILIPDSLHELEDKTKRVKEYDKECLRGVIFGIRINIEDKIKLIEKIRNLLKNINDFEFYQAFYDEEYEKIIFDKINLLYCR